MGERLLLGSGGEIEWESLAHSSKGGHFHGSRRVASLGHEGRQCDRRELTAQTDGSSAGLQPRGSFPSLSADPSLSAFLAGL